MTTQNRCYGSSSGVQLHGTVRQREMRIDTGLLCRRARCQVGLPARPTRPGHHLLRESAAHGCPFERPSPTCQLPRRARRSWQRSPGHGHAHHKSTPPESPSSRWVLYREACRLRCGAMVIGVLIAAGLLTWAGSTLLLDATWRRWEGPDLVERLLPLRPGSIADEAELWLQSPHGDKNP
jgi:hypothetical protein